MTGVDPTATSPPARMPLVSVIMACYNQAHFLAEAIESVLAQSYPHYELILVDDGSVDDSRAVAQQYASVRYIYQPHAGLIAARNHGLAESRGPFLVILDSDDRLLPHHLARSLQAFREHPDSAIVTGDYKVFGTGETHHVHQCTAGVDHFETMLWEVGFPGPPATSMFRTAIVRQMGGFRMDLRANADFDLFLRIVRRCPLHCHHDVVVEYRRHAGQRTKDSALMLDSFMRVLRFHRDYVRARPQYHAAYQHAYHLCTHTHGEWLAWEVMAALKRARFRQAARGLKVLLRWYPAGFVLVMRHRLAMAFGIPAAERP